MPVKLNSGGKVSKFARICLEKLKELKRKRENKKEQQVEQNLNVSPFLEKKKDLKI